MGMRRFIGPFLFQFISVFMAVAVTGIGVEVEHRCRMCG
jgi:hypothetical protein